MLLIHKSDQNDIGNEGANHLAKAEWKMIQKIKMSI